MCDFGFCERWLPWMLGECEKLFFLVGWLVGLGRKGMVVQMGI